MVKKDDLNRTAIFFNDEYIGEADKFLFEKGDEQTMSSLNIKGEYQAGKE